MQIILQNLNNQFKIIHVSDEEWRMSIKDQLEAELSRRVREALETPSSQQQRPPVVSQQQDDDRDLDTLNSHITMDELQLRERELTSNRRWKLIQTKRKIHDMFSRGSQHLHFGGAFDERYPNIEHYEELQSLRRDEYEELVRSYGGGDPNNDSSSHYGNRSHSQEFYDRLAIKVKNDYGNLTPTERLEFFYAFTKNGFREAMRTGRFPDGSQLEVLPNGKFKDKYGIIRDEHGPFWPADYGPLFSSPNHQKQTDRKCEPMVLPDKTGRWRHCMANIILKKFYNFYTDKCVPHRHQCMSYKTVSKRFPSQCVMRSLIFCLYIIQNRYIPYLLVYKPRGL